mmetsp:Transcript_1416/g.4445  ORF Transcript_1416/g.4445 Transcript_1416/m.4445 type:complete len:248 (+) Transcript_1416:2032-2775(+)
MFANANVHANERLISNGNTVASLAFCTLLVSSSTPASPFSPPLPPNDVGGSTNLAKSGRTENVANCLAAASFSKSYLTASPPLNSRHSSISFHSTSSSALLSRSPPPSFLPLPLNPTFALYFTRNETSANFQYGINVFETVAPPPPPAAFDDDGEEEESTTFLGRNGSRFSHLSKIASASFSVSTVNATVFARHDPRTCSCSRPSRSLSSLSSSSSSRSKRGEFNDDDDDENSVLAARRRTPRGEGF